MPEAFLSRISMLAWIYSCHGYFAFQAPCKLSLIQTVCTAFGLFGPVISCILLAVVHDSVTMTIIPTVGPQMVPSALMCAVMPIVKQSSLSSPSAVFWGWWWWSLWSSFVFWPNLRLVAEQPGVRQRREECYWYDHKWLFSATFQIDPSSDWQWHRTRSVSDWHCRCVSHVTNLSLYA